MTRETKIGLLVGLAFIIIVGILLSEPLSHSGDAQPAPLPGIAQNVRNGVTTPGAGSVQPPISQQQPQQPVTPQQQVPMEREVSHPNTAIVEIGPAGTHQPNQMSTLAGNGNGSGRPNTLVGPRVGSPSRGGSNIQVGGPSQPGTNVPSGTQIQPENAVADGRGIDHSDPRFGAANANGEELVPVGPQGSDRSHPTAPRSARNDARGSKSYAAVQGDSLSKMSVKFYGSNSKALRDLIASANPSLKQNSDRIIAGQTYVIPAAPAQVDAGAQASGPSTPSTPSSSQGQATQSGTASAPEYWYTVKENDNLWRIAKEQLGDAGAVAALKELNKDVLHGNDVVRINMKLRLPAKPLASAS